MAARGSLLCKTHNLSAIAGSVALLLGIPIGASAENGWVTMLPAFSDTGAFIRGVAKPSELVHVVVALKLRNEDMLDSLVATVTAQRRINKNSFYTAAAVRRSFYPTADQSNKVANYLESAGFQSIRVSDNNVLVSATGTPDAVRRAFNTELAHVRSGRSFGIANMEPVQIPGELAGTIRTVMGLQNLGKVGGFLITPCPTCKGTSGGPQTGLKPASLATVYGASGLAAASSTSVGIIALGDMDKVISDFAVAEGSSFTPTVVYADTKSDEELVPVEFELDSQVLYEVAGSSLKSMTFYAGDTLDPAQIAVAINKAVSDDTAKVISCSIGESENVASGDGLMAGADPALKIAIVQGQTFAAASGDTGANTCFNTAGVCYPAASPYVIAVGGTSPTFGPGNTYSSETAWTSGGGGPSQTEVMPSWQQGIVPGAMRGVPDVAFDASQQGGVLISYYNGPGGQLGPIYGTSLAAPIFAGLFARLQSEAGNSIPFPSQLIYHYPNGKRSVAFHDVTTGSNGAYSAAVGWDYTTGFGSLDAAYVKPLAIAIPGIIAYLLTD